MINTKDMLVLWYGAWMMRCGCFLKVDLVDECDRRVADSVEKLASCTDKLVEMKSMMENSQEEVKDLRVRMKALEKEEKELRAVIESERTGCSAKLRELGNDLEQERSRGSTKYESALEELERIKTAWLPVWMSSRLEKVQPIISPAHPYVMRAIEYASYIWNKFIVPLTMKVRNQGSMMGKRVFWMTMKGMRQAWQRHVPEKYRTLVISHVSKGTQAISFVVNYMHPHVTQYSRYIKAQLDVIVREISGMVESLADMYPEQIGWAKTYSVPIAFVILCFPFTFIGMPLLASRLQSRRARSSRKQRKKKKSNK